MWYEGSSCASKNYRCVRCDMKEVAVQQVAAPVCDGWKVETFPGAVVVVIPGAILVSVASASQDYQLGRLARPRS